VWRWHTQTEVRGTWGLLFGHVRRRYLALAPAALIVFGLTVGTAAARIPALYKNCTAFHTKYPHGVGKVGARDRTKSGDPVTTFKRSNRIYAIAMRYNDDLDRDKDGVACEKT
jgi:hypothetical protein